MMNKLNNPSLLEIIKVFEVRIMREKVFINIYLLFFKLKSLNK